MNILNIIKKELIQTARDKKSVVMMILFPILLIVVLGAALKSNFDNSIGNADVLYSITSNSEAAKSFKENIIDNGKKFNINFKKTKNTAKSKELLKKTTKYDSLIVMTENNMIKVYRNSNNGMLSGLSNSIVESFAAQYNTIYNIARENPSKLKQVMAEGNGNTNYAKITSIGELKTPTSLDYYAVTMTTLIIMYGISTSLYSMIGERNGKTQGRIMVTPVRKYEFLTGKILGIMFSLMLQILIEFLITKYLMGVYWGNNIPVVLLILFSQIIMVVSIGAAFGFIFKNENAAQSIINIFVPVMVFLAGGYMPVDDLGGKLFQTIRNISPVNWTNKAIFGAVYSGDMTKVFPAVSINILVAIVLIGIASITFRKETV